MTAEAIGRVVRDLRRGRVHLIGIPSGLRDEAMVADLRLIQEAEIVDVTAIYDSQQTDPAGWMVYEQSVCRPPLANVAYSWVNQFGNVIIAHAATTERDSTDLWTSLRWESEAETHVIDWERVQWVTGVWLWSGGYSTSTNRHMPTRGPVGLVMMAIDADGTVQDLHWRATAVIDVPDVGGFLLNEAATVTRAITFLNCRNVQILEPARPRPERRRVERTGVTVTEIHVKPIGSYYRGKPKLGPVPLSATGPLSMVRGHVARYGIDGRGLLFGKLSGEFWIPAHHRGTADQGEVRHEYEVNR